MSQDDRPHRKVPPPQATTGRTAGGWPAQPPLDQGHAGGLPACATGVKTGQEMTPALQAKLAGGGGKVRILRPNDMATMDLVPDRLNIYLDAQNRIERITCG